MSISSDKKKELKRKYEERHVEKGIICLTSKGRSWVMYSNDINADKNGIEFQLKLGSWPMHELLDEYKKDPESFSWSVAKVLEYEDNTKDYTDDLKLMLMDYLDKNKDAKLMKPRLL